MHLASAVTYCITVQAVVMHLLVNQAIGPVHKETKGLAKSSMFQLDIFWKNRHDSWTNQRHYKQKQCFGTIRDIINRNSI